MDDLLRLTRPDGLRLALLEQSGDRPGILFLHGLMSDMQGHKARAVAAHAAQRGWSCLRLDLSGHGRSEGAFRDGTVSQWRDDALLALERSRAPVILVGSSIGGWLALLLALARPQHVAGLLLVAPAPDMTARLQTALPEQARAALRDDGVWLRPSRYGAEVPITARMVADGDRHCLLEAAIAVSCPVRILHGQADPDVPWQGSLRLAEQLRSDDVQLILFKHGDHQLSKPHELDLLLRTLDGLHDLVREVGPATAG